MRNPRLFLLFALASAMVLLIASSALLLGGRSAAIGENRRRRRRESSSPTSPPPTEEPQVCARACPPSADPCQIPRCYVIEDAEECVFIASTELGCPGYVSDEEDGDEDANRARALQIN